MPTFRNIFVIGSGSPALHCVEMLLAQGVKCSFLETSAHLSSFARLRLSSLGVSVLPVSQTNMGDYLNTPVPTLVLSVNNLLIFPENIVRQSHLTIFNYHNSLLPLHRGVHAEAWAIFANDKMTGVSWHKVDRGIDTGEILAQREFPIPKDITSAQLLKLQAHEAINLLNENLDRLLSGNFVLKEQPFCADKAHKMAERPNNGILDTEWDEERIWSFLRAYDYGITANLGTPKVNIGGIWHSWRKYGKVTERSNLLPVFPATFKLGDILLQELSPYMGG